MIIALCVVGVVHAFAIIKLLGRIERLEARLASNRSEPLTVQLSIDDSTIIDTLRRAGKAAKGVPA